MSCSQPNRLPIWPDRNRLVLSSGHASMLLWSVLPPDKDASRAHARGHALPQWAGGGLDAGNPMILGVPDKRRVPPRSAMPDDDEKRGDLVLLAVVSCIAGSLTGFIVAMFRIALMKAEIWRQEWIARGHFWPVGGVLITVAVVSAATACAAWLVRRFSPDAAGSGIPHVEAVAKGELPPEPLTLLPVKFIGGWLAIGGGLALGREGPSVQMGAKLGNFLGKAFRFRHSDCVALLAAGGGAGLATAFNAPIAGAVFVLEELIRCFDTRLAIAALGASSCAIAIARIFLGPAPDFRVEALPFSGPGTGLLFLLLGIAAGFAGMAYNRSVLGALSLADRLRWPAELRAAAIGALVGALAWLAPSTVGGGDPLTQQALSGGYTIVFLLWAFPLRFLLGPVSYAAATPGGLFAPMLVLGAQLGSLFAALCGLVLSHPGAPPAAFAMVGMAAFFTAVVRAPVTGIVLIVELTAGFTQLLPMLWACLPAMAIPTLFRVEPIYDLLRPPSTQRERA